MAAIVPPTRWPSSAINSPRRRTNCSALSKSSAPAATSAEYSPKLWPATTSGCKPCASSTRNTATLCVSRAGWATSVAVSSSAGPSLISRESSISSTASACSITAAAAGYCSATSAPMPTYCDPCPGKIKAIIIAGAPIRSPALLGQSRSTPARPQTHRQRCRSERRQRREQQDPY